MANQELPGGYIGGQELPAELPEGGRNRHRCLCDVGAASPRRGVAIHAGRDWARRWVTLT